jgi:RimK family alpha-L-glutamate ligase
MPVLDHVKPGDEIAIAGTGHLASSPSLHGEVLEVWGLPGQELCKVVWSDGNVTVVPFVVTSGSTSAPAARRSSTGRVRVLGSEGNSATVGMTAAWRRLGLDAEVVGGAAALASVRPDDIVLGRLDVLPTLDGVEPGSLALFLLERQGVRVINGIEGVLGAHDKLRTARLLARAHLPHPATVVVRASDQDVPLRPPVVVKPRFGSWGRDVFRCEDPVALRRCLSDVRERSWFRRHGALVQQYVPGRGSDLRVVVAGGRVVGCAERTGAAGEWRTNVSLGGTLRPTILSDDVAELARSAAAAVDADFVGVDLLPVDGRGYLVLELNAAVDLDETYSIDGRGVFAEIAAALDLR